MSSTISAKEEKIFTADESRGEAHQPLSRTAAIKLLMLKDLTVLALEHWDKLRLE